MKKLSQIMILALLVTLFACESGSTNKSKTSSTNNVVNRSNSQGLVIKKVLQTSSYTYIKYLKDGEISWGAIPRRNDIVIGNTYYGDKFMEMNKFHSKELDRTFATIYFIGAISDKPLTNQPMAMKKKTGSAKVGNMEVEKITPVKGETTVEDLYKDKSAFAGKTILVHGKVVKFTAEVMKKNWVHLQDGTKSGENFDITITTPDFVKVGDIVSFKGTVVLNKDFGYGYKYDVLIENAKLIK